MQVHALVNAYAPMSANGAIMEAKRIQEQIRRGDAVYVDTKKASELLDRSGLQLPRLPSLNTDPLKILTKKTGRLSARRTGHGHSGCGAFVRHPVQPGASRQPAQAVRFVVVHQGETE